MFPVTQVPEHDAGIFEPLGTKAKFWYDDDRFLFKEGRIGTGENWAEVVCAEVAKDLQLPHATYRLAEFLGRRGVSTPNFVPNGGRLVLGNELIRPVAANATAVRQVRRQAHTIRRISGLLRQPVINPPHGWPVPTAAVNAGGVMAGYLLLDALVGNQDRHEENWGLVVLDGELFLAPTFDHASSLGRNEADDSRLAKLAASNAIHGIWGYARRAKSQIFDSAGVRMSTINAFLEFGLAFPDGAKYWLHNLKGMSQAYFEQVLDSVPQDWISEPAKEFAAKLLEANRLRLLESSE